MKYINERLLIIFIDLNISKINHQFTHNLISFIVFE